MTDKPEALKWADALENGSTYDVGSSVAYGWIKNDPTDEAAAELRRLHAENETLRRLLQRAVDFEEGTRLPHWATPGWVADSIEELARAEGASHD